MVSIFDCYELVFNELKKYFEDYNAIENAVKNIHNEYEKKCGELTNSLSDELKANVEKQAPIKAYINIASAHAISLIASDSALNYDSGNLKRLSVQINNASRNDIFAEQLYTEATGQLKYLMEEAENIQKIYSEKKQNLSRIYENDSNKSNKKLKVLEDKVTGYLNSDEFGEFISQIELDRSIFNFDENQKVKHELTSVSIGSSALPIFIPHDYRHKLAEATNNLYNAITRTINVPVSLDLSTGSVTIVEYANNNEQTIISGIQNVLLNIARYYEKDFNQITFFDPIRFNNSSLGCLSLLARDNFLISNVPSSMENIRKKVLSIIANISDEEKKLSDNLLTEIPKNLYVFHNFPHAYDSTLISQIQQLCVNAPHYGITIILTNNSSAKSTVANDIFAFLRTQANMISLNEIEWYQAPKALPSSLMHYIKEKQAVNLSNVYEERIDISSMPHYKKGNRLLTNIPFGVDSNGNILELDFENSNFATFICGAARSGKSTLLHALITGIIKNSHPDDVELWLIDFKMTEFSRYIANLPPHVRYIILDESPELVYDIIDRLTDILIKRQNLFKGKWTKLSEVPSDKYMPEIFVVIDEFSIMSQIIAESIVIGENYKIKLQTLLAKGSALGFRFIFSSQGFTDGTRGLSDFSKQQIQQRIAMKAKYSDIKETLDLVSTSDDDKAMMEQLPIYHALIRVPVDFRGNHLLLAKTLNISDYSTQEKYIDILTNELTTASKYDVLNKEVYVYKKPMVIDGNNYLSFTSKIEEIKNYLTPYKESNEDAFVLFVGEPRRMMPIYPIEITNDFNENLLVIAPSVEKMATTSIILSILEVLQLQDIVVEFWSEKRNSVFRQAVTECKISTTANVTGIENICDQIREVKENIESKHETSKMFVLFGFESIINDMAYYSFNASNSVILRETKVADVTYEKRGKDEPDILSILAAIESGIEISIPDAGIKKDNIDAQEDDLQSTIYDAREDLSYILTHGPKLGYHFVLLCNTVGEFDQTKLKVSLFKHKLMFRTAKSDAMSIVGTANAGVISELEDRSFRYSDGINCLSFKPYLHPGLSWDGWHMDGSDAVNATDEEYEYLM